MLFESKLTRVTWWHAKLLGLGAPMALFLQDKTFELMFQYALGRHRWYVVDLPGLLLSRSLPPNLKNLLSFCANPSDSPDVNIRTKAGPETMAKLKEMLQEIKREMG